MKKHKELIDRLEQHQTRAPEDFTERVMDALPAWRPAKRKSWWARQRQWMVPALAGATAMLVVMLGLSRFAASPDAPAAQQLVSLHFELHAPGADKVELLGTFNSWQTGDVVLVGPDASGHWTATVELPEGRHEYIFLVDGERWMADPKAATLRPDGFGHVNSVIQVYDENNV
jgi:hypothetical protein